MTYEQEIAKAVIDEGYTTTLAALLIAQAKFESGNFTNTAFKFHKNAYGYKYYPGSSWQTAEQGNKSSEGDPYANYTSLYNSTKEVIYWLKRREKEGKLKISELLTPELYAAALKKSGYYGANEQQYAAGLKVYFTNAVDLVKKNPLITLFAIAIGMFFLMKIYK
jgi:hypothetical protein